MIWIYRNNPRGFEELSLAEMASAGLTQVSDRFFYGDRFELEKSAYGNFSVREVARGSSPEEVIKNFSENIPSPYRVEKFEKKRRRGSTSYAVLAEKIHGGTIRACDPKSIILVFSPDKVNWIAGFVTEKKNSFINRLEAITERTCVSLPAHAALALVNISGNNPVIDPCCGTGMLPLASILLNKETHASDNNLKMLNMARTNRDTLGLDLKIQYKEALEPWIDDCCLISDFPADKAWNSNTEDISLVIFKRWVPYIKNFCVIFPNQILKKLPENIVITKMIKFTGGRTIVLGESLRQMSMVTG